ncbi:DNA transposase THAP9 isoform X3 [Parasteatoda tepidariorum]|uniref:DNA transposase THAP9 isoform X3 n=1 Tax=Parasteatoda tepidariorum TaxID=114398 RepID=UPI0039BD70B7
MTSCVAYGCTNRWTKKMTGITFHSFPKDEKRKQLWIKAVRRVNWKPSSCSKLCNEHFSEDMIDRTSLSCVRLRPNAIPSIFPAFPPHLKKEHKSRKPPSAYIKEKSTDNNTVLSNNPSTSNEEIILSQSPTKEACKRKIDLLSEIIESKNKKIKVLHQKTRRYKKKVTSLNILFSELQKKKLVDEDAIHVLETVSSVNKEFLTRQLASASNQAKPKAYLSELRAFALTLHFYSPRAYEFVRKTFNLALPHQRTLARWYQRIDGEPGFTDECFHAVELKIKNTAYHLYFSLVFDEMAIRQHVEFDGENFHGRVTLGQNENDDSLPLAKEAFVVLLVCINDHWKLPLGYFLTAGINTSQKKTLLSTCLTLLHEIGADVVSLTFDGLATNLTMTKNFGCCLEHENLITTFQNPANSNSFISVFLDPSHMLKLVRNTFGDKGSIASENSLIEFRFIKELNKLQENEGLHLANKLRAAHVNYFKQKMKVKLASQLFSKSVADSIEYCRVKLKLPQFEGSEAIVEFLRIFIDLFDCLNTRSLSQYGFKKAINEKNFNEIESFLRISDSYISSLKVCKNGNKILDSNRKTGFFGFKICIKSLLNLIQRLIFSAKTPLIFFPCYKVSQYHLELFFFIY